MDLPRQCSEDSFLLKDDQSEQFLLSLTNNRVLASELLLYSPGVISDKLNKTENEINEFVWKYKNETLARIKRSLTHPFDPESSEIRPDHFTIGDESIDKKLNGGIPVGYLIEVSGKSSCGKTNLLLTLSITIQLPKEFGGLGPSVFSSDHASTQLDNVKTLYVPTESPLPSQRLKQIVDNYAELLQTNGISKERADLFPKLDNVLTTSSVMSTLDEQDHILQYQIPAMLSRDPSIKLLIIDSMTHHLRVQLPWKEQSRYVRKTCRYLKTLARKYSITIIISNQVTDKPVKGLLTGENDILWKLNTEYQQAWMSGWDNIGIIYRQLMKREGIIDEAGESFERLDYLDEISSADKFSQITNDSMTDSTGSTQQTQKQSLKSVLRLERKQLFDSSYKVKVSGIGTRPALGLTLLENIDMRIVLSKEYAPILNENLIDEFSVELGIDSFNDSCGTSHENNSISNTNYLETATQNKQNENMIDKKQLVESLANNTYLKNYNFETFRTIRCVFGPLIPPGETKSIEFEIWKGGLRKYVR